MQYAARLTATKQRGYKMAKHNNKASKAQAVIAQASEGEAIESLPVAELATTSEVIAQASEGEAVTEKPLFLGKYAPRIAKRGLTAENLLAAPLPAFKQGAMVLAIGTESPKVNSKSVHTELLSVFASLLADNEQVTGNMLVTALVAHNWQAGRNSAYIAAKQAGRMAFADWCIGYLQGALRRKYIVAK